MLTRRDLSMGLAAAAAAGARFCARRTDSLLCQRRPQVDALWPGCSAASLTPIDSITLPANVQYAWPHPSGNFSMSWPATPSRRGPMGATGADKNHYALAFKVGAMAR
jgi:hypothetical protein